MNHRCRAIWLLDHLPVRRCHRDSRESRSSSWTSSGYDRTNGPPSQRKCREGGICRTQARKNCRPNNIRVRLSVKFAVGIRNRCARRSHEESSRLMMSGPKKVLPKPSPVRVRLRLRGLPLLVRRIPVFDICRILSQRQCQVKCCLIHGGPKLAVVRCCYEINVRSPHAPLISLLTHIYPTHRRVDIADSRLVFHLPNAAECDRYPIGILAGKKIIDEINIRNHAPHILLRIRCPSISCSNLMVKPAPERAATDDQCCSFDFSGRT